MALTVEDAPLTQEDFNIQEKVVNYTTLTMEPRPRPQPAEFIYDKLIPGVRYYIRTGDTHHQIPRLKPGEVLDLGTVIMD